MKSHTDPVGPLSPPLTQKASSDTSMEVHTDHALLHGNRSLTPHNITKRMVEMTGVRHRIGTLCNTIQLLHYNDDRVNHSKANCCF